MKLVRDSLIKLHVLGQGDVQKGGWLNRRWRGFPGPER